jgi:hypothetical protein
MWQFRRTSWIRLWLAGWLSVNLPGAWLGFDCHCLVPSAHGGPCADCPDECQSPTTEVGPLARGSVGSTEVGSLAGGLVGLFPSSKPANLRQPTSQPANQPTSAKPANQLTSQLAAVTGRGDEAAWMAAESCPCLHVPHGPIAGVTTRVAADSQDLPLVLAPAAALFTLEQPSLQPILRLPDTSPPLLSQRITPALSRRGPPSLV